MTTLERAQQVESCVADAVCSTLAFTFACLGFTALQGFLLQILPTSLTGTEEAVASSSGPLLLWHDLLWICLISTIVMNVTLSSASRQIQFAARRRSTTVLAVLLAVAIAGCLISAISFVLHIALPSRLFVLSYLAYLFALSATYRLASLSGLFGNRLRGSRRPRVLIAGTPEGVRLYEQRLSLGEQTVEIVGALTTDPSTGTTDSKLPSLGHLSTLGDFLIHQPIDAVLIVLPTTPSPWLSEVLQSCDYFRVSAHIIHEALCGIEFRDLSATRTFNGMPVTTLVPEEDSLSHMLFWKRVVDVVLSGIALILLAPLMAAIALAIKITTPRLPVFYSWSAVGYRGHHFRGYKFTTMVADAESKKGALAHLNEMDGPVFKIKNDPRMTRLGKYLRKYSLNELPQFWSVFIGDMSLVGPRPALPGELTGYSLWHKRKLSIQPGITCFWQVRGRNAICNFDEWVQMDLEYIQKRSIQTDLYILLHTVKVVFRGSGS